MVVIGPSAVGKSTLVRELHRRHLARVIPTWTTRPRRADEWGFVVEHRFVTDGGFDAGCAAGFFAATGTLPGLPYRYGLPHFGTAVGTPPELVMVRASYVPMIATLAPEIVVYQVEDGLDRVRRRLAARAGGPREATARLESFDDELAVGRRVADRVFRNDGTPSDLLERVSLAIACDTRLVDHPSVPSVPALRRVS